MKPSKKIYETSGDAEAYGIAKLMCTYKFVACLFMLCDVLHTLAKLQGSLQSKDLDLATIPTLIQCTLSRLMEIKESVSSSTWFKEHMNVFTDSTQLGTWNISVTQTDQEGFINSVYRPYIQSVIDHVRTRLRSSDVFSAFSVFDPSNLPDSEESLSSYGTDTISVLTDFYGRAQQVKLQDEVGHSSPDVDTALLRQDYFAVDEQLRSSPVCINQERGDGRAIETDIMKGCVTVERVECVTGIDQKNCFSPILLVNISYSMNC